MRNGITGLLLMGALVGACGAPQTKKYGDNFAACMADVIPDDVTDLVPKVQDALLSGPNWQSTLTGSVGNIALDTLICAVKAAIALWQPSGGAQRLGSNREPLMSPAVQSAIQRGNSFLTAHNVK